MNTRQVRNCPICLNNKASCAFPYVTIFDSVRFKYLRCDECHCIFVDKIPSNETFRLMYAKDTYHDCGYEGEIGGTYKDSVKLLSKYITTGMVVLDYGCGLGDFLKLLNDNGFESFGVEFDLDAVNFASKKTSCTVWTVDYFWKSSLNKKFDAIHLGDVLEHLPNPVNTLNEVLESLKPKGVLFVEGPLENNHSPVFWAIRIYGYIKHVIQPSFIASDPPHHLFRVGEAQQLRLFNSTKAHLKLKYWHIYESGWPYIEGNIFKRIIARIAILIGGKKMINVTFGNRFQAIFVKK
jgi:2-polyprenyl-3-methyl-5-hydroxy-6-metoxy-1,4-benzoquinol methylase